MLTEPDERDQAMALGDTSELSGSVRLLILSFICYFETESHAAWPGSPPMVLTSYHYLPGAGNTSAGHQHSAAVVWRQGLPLVLPDPNSQRYSC